jgi:hypothetical protein
MLGEHRCEHARGNVSEFWMPQRLNFLEPDFWTATVGRFKTCLRLLPAPAVLGSGALVDIGDVSAAHSPGRQDVVWARVIPMVH